MFRMGNCLKADSQVISDDKIVISVVGLDDSGKSTTVKVLKGDKELNDVSPTVGYEPHDIKYESKYVTLYDLGGGSRVRDIWKHYMAESYGFIYVIDASNRHRVQEAKTVFTAFIENEKVAGKPVLILANKQDQPNSLDESEIVQHLNIEELVNKYQIPCRVESCIALSGIGKKLDQSLKIGFDWLFKYIILNLNTLKSKVDEDTKNQRYEESLIRKEKSERVKRSRGNRYDDDDDYADNPDENPFKRLDELKNKDSKTKSSLSNGAKLTAYERQLIDEMDSNTKSRLSTINEERSKFKGLRNNRLVPIDDSKQTKLKGNTNYYY